MKTKKLLTLLSSSALLSATLLGCGGGGDDGISAPTTPAVPTNPASITASNYVTVASEAYGAIGEFLSLGASTGSFVSTAAVNGSNSVNGSDSLLTVTVDLAKSNLKPAGQPVVQPAVLISDSSPVACTVSGTVSRTLDDLNGDLSFSYPGESLTLSFTNCVMDANEAMLNGSLAFTLNSLSGDPSSNLADWAFNMGLSFTNFKMSYLNESTTFNGGYTLAASYGLTSDTETETVTGASLTASWSDSVGTGIAQLSSFSLVYVFNYGAQTYTADADYTLASSKLNGVVTVVTAPVFSGTIDTSGNLSNPTSGTMVVTGANNARVKIEAQSDGVNVLLSLDADGDGFYEITQLVTWATLTS